jgi:hypothetical protein
MLGCKVSTNRDRRKVANWVALSGWKWKCSSYIAVWLPGRAQSKAKENQLKLLFRSQIRIARFNARLHAQCQKVDRLGT